MKPTFCSELATIMGAKPHGVSQHIVATGVCLDSREVKPGDLFVAIKGERVDGHDYVASALAAGAVAALVERPVDGPCLVVDNIVEALAMLGRHYRGQFAGPVVGVTGSSGKSTVKEFIAAALGALGPVLKTEGNRNTEYSAPLVWLEQGDQKSAVIEMGMRGPSQIAHLAGIAQPKIGVITNIGYSHLEQLGSRGAIATAKGELVQVLPSDGMAVLWADDFFMGTLVKLASCPYATFGFGKGATCQVLDYKIDSWTQCTVTGVLSGEKWEAQLPTIGRHMALNAAAAILAVNPLGIAPAEAARRLAYAEIPPMRMQVVKHGAGLVLLDTYNASFAGMLSAIETISEAPVHGRRLAVIGTMRELGSFEHDAHEQVGEAISRSRIEEVLFYGEPMRDAMAAVGRVRARMAGSMDDVRQFLGSMRPGDVTLVKGSRALELERALEVG